VKIEFQSVADHVREILKRDASCEERARAIAEEIRGAGPYRWVGIYEVRESDVRIIAFSGPGTPAFPTFSREKGLTGEMLRRHATVVSGDVSGDANYLTAFSTTRSEMIVPVRSRGRAIIGTIDIESEKRNAFGDADLETAEAIAGLIEPLFWR
jgi:GAF domain-containing protein